MSPEPMATAPTSIPLSYNGKTVALPLIEGTEGEVAIDIRNLRAQTGLITFDPGYANTGACKSAITFIDGEQGILRYRGYPIEDLAERSSFLEVAWLLLHGELPTKAELDSFSSEIVHHTLLHENFTRFFNAFPKDAHPMPLCAAAVAAMATFYQEPESEDTIHKTVIRLLAKMPTIAAYSYKHYIGQPFIYPKNDLDYCSNFMRMMFATPCEEYEANDVVVRALDRIFILHADHEQNASTSTVRLCGSSGTNPFAAIAAGVACLWGPAHGGANEAALTMLEDIQRAGGVEKIGEFIRQVKDKNSSVKLMGFGHRVYKSYDPRAKIVKSLCDDVLRVAGLSKDMEIALELERIALSDEYFIARKLYPNVDFYTGLIYRAMHFPTDYFTVLFAIARTAGWMAQWEELLLDKEQKIARPRQIYTGYAERGYQAKVDLSHKITK